MSQSFYQVLKIPEQNKVSGFTLLLLMLLLTGISTGLFSKMSNIISWDTFGYYLYLPATFIYNDPGLSQNTFVEEALKKYQSSVTFYQASPGPRGGMIIKYAPGLAIVFLPGFALAHLAALGSHFPADGFSIPYQYGVFLTSLAFALLGVFMIRKVLLRFVSDTIAAITLILLYAGTNLFFVSITHVLVHNFLFALYALLLWLVMRWHETPSYKNSAYLGLCIGLMTAIRPTEAIAAFIPMFWGVYNKATFVEKTQWVRSHFRQILLTGATIVLPLLPQLIYWKVFTGSLLHYTYDNPGEGLDILSPHTLNALFSFRKGWLIYTPMMAFAIWGFINVYKQNRKIFYSLLVFAALNLYLTSSWTTWWYAGSFGQRAMVQSYAIMALPLAYFLAANFELKKIYRNALLALLGLFMALNLFQTWQYYNGIIHPERMTWPYYKAVFGRISPPTSEMKGLLLVERSLDANDPFENPGEYYLFGAFEAVFESDSGDTSGHPLSEKAGQAMILTPERPFTPALEVPFRELTPANHAFLIVRGKVFIEENPAANPFTLVVTFDHKGGNYKYRGLDIEKHTQPFIAGEWNIVEMVYLTPEPRRKTDKLRTYFWLRGQKPMAVKEIKVEVWVPKRGW